MIDDITSIQSRIASIQDKIASISAQATPSIQAAATRGQHSQSFDQALADQRSRYGSLRPPTGETADLPLPIGRRPLVPFAPPLPASATTGPQVAPFVPRFNQIMPVKS